MSNYFERIDTVFLYVSDLEKSIEWYTTVLGLKLIWNMGEYAALSVAKGETPLTLAQVPKEEICTSTWEKFNFFTSDIDKVQEALIVNGVEADPINEADGVRFFNFKDPDGNTLGACYFE